MATLYRKYRPQSFKNVIGQNHIKITLQNEIELGQIGHAYLFCGPRGLGKTTFARLFAKAINCENRKDGESEPCNTCDSCNSIMDGSNMDIIEIDAASHTGVDNVRENIIENARFTPNKSKYKVFIIDEVHMLSTSAFNALLKTLEEPPEHAIFILCTTETHKVPQTIISRCQRFDLKKINGDELLEKLRKIVLEEKKKVDDDVLKNIVVYSEGCVRDAESLLGKILTLGDNITSEQAELVLPRSDFKTIITFLEYIVEGNSTAGVELINKLIEEGVDLHIFTDDLLEFLRKIMLLKINGNLSDYSIELDEASQKSAETLAERFEYAKLLSAIELFLEKRKELKSAVIQQLPLEIAVVQLTQDIVCKVEKPVEFKPVDPTPTPTATPVNPPSESIPPKVETPDPLPAVEEPVKVEPAPVEKKKIIEGAIDDIKKIKEKWQEIIDFLSEKNFTMSSLLRISEPVAIVDGNLEIAVRSQFYKDRLEDAKNQTVVEETIAEICQGNVCIKGVIKENMSPIDSNHDNTQKVVFGQPASLRKASPAGQKPPEPKEPNAPIKSEKPKDVIADVEGLF